MTLEEILTTVAIATNHSIKELEGKRRFMKLVNARQLYCYLARVKTKLPYATIGKIIGHKEHTGVMHSINVISDLIETKHPLTLKHLEAFNRIRVTTFYEGDKVFILEDDKIFEGTIHKNEYPEVSEWYIKYLDGQELAVLDINQVYKIN